MYFAWPLIPQASSQLESIFWGTWLVFFMLVVGANLANLLQLNDPPVMEQDYEQRYRTHNY
ncbi:hypothetical protein [Paracerasibacillus soli]|uniref:Uncharacterized protein n=2 Tax=Paracerasibacillus soli TaxID=480284 RepID=A0ABU5CQN7_9BACI|nr:hypothetical protein [Virgibacillus soli]MDY0408661.1 hypothetical protein [Virgibacillus soli]